MSGVGEGRGQVGELERLLKRPLPTSATEQASFLEDLKRSEVPRHTRKARRRRDRCIPGGYRELSAAASAALNKFLFKAVFCTPYSHRTGSLHRRPVPMPSSYASPAVGGRRRNRISEMQTATCVRLRMVVFFWLAPSSGLPTIQ